jgi:hypothetical protein
VLAAGDPHGYQGGVLPFCTDDGFSIEMVQALDEAHAVDIVQALQPGGISQAVPATSLEGKNKYRPLGLDGRPGADHDH